ncbi:MAG: hypothetical protein WCF18_02860 [Chthoniobacteraceae bacterium]
MSLGYPLHRLTSIGESPAVVAPALPAAAVREITLQLTFSVPPKTLRVLHAGQAVWTEDAPSEEMERKLRLAFPPEGIDLQFQAEFDADAKHAAMRVKLTDPEGNEREKSLWGAGTIDDVLSFP